ncbi:MAG: DHH family phosphoesterase [Chloroflexota bacterium]|nr:DHH family phosphoesterase [Chloroflexota bacterium]
MNARADHDYQDVPPREKAHMTRRAALRRAAARLRAATTVLITTHLGADADGLGSSLALASALERIGVPAAIALGCAIPARYTYIDAAGRAKVYGTDDPLPEADVVVVLDTSSGWDRIGAPGVTIAARQAAAECTVICLDHHPHAALAVDIPVIDPQATAVAVLTYQLILLLTRSVTPQEAGWLYLGIVTDTASFRFPNTNAEAHRIVADLADHGADERRLYAEMYENTSVAKIRLLGEALLGIQLTCNGHLAVMTVTRDQFKRYGLTVEDAPGFADHAATVEGAAIGAALLEFPDARTRVILRASGNVPVDLIAQAIGGGGHTFAAAAVIAGNADDALRMVVDSSCAFLTPDLPRNATAAD